MYYEHYGLSRPPFKITPDTSLFFPGGRRGETLQALIYAVCTGEGIVKVVGEVGSGKTMLSRMLEIRLPERVEIVYLANPSMAPGDIAHAIAIELGLKLSADASRLETLNELQAALLAKHAEGKQIVCFVEEAQSMPIETLEEVRLLSNLETHQDKLLQIVLFGQPELDETLNKPEIRQLRERIVHSFHLQPFGPDEVREYLTFRLQAAGYRGPDVFDRAAYRVIAKASTGLIRRLNVLADKSLLAAFADGTHTVSAKHARSAVQDSEFGRTSMPGRTTSVGRLGWVAGILIIAAIVIGVATNWPKIREQLASSIYPEAQTGARHGETPTERQPSEAASKAVTESVSDAPSGSQAMERTQSPAARGSMAAHGGEAAKPASVSMLNAASGSTSGPAPVSAAISNSASDSAMSTTQETALVSASGSPTVPDAEGASMAQVIEVSPSPQSVTATAQSPIVTSGQQSALAAGTGSPPVTAGAGIVNSTPIASGSSARASMQVRATGSAAADTVSLSKTESAPTGGAGNRAARPDPNGFDRSRVSRRLSETNEWLQQQPGASPDRFSIQIMLTRRDNWRKLDAWLDEWVLERGVAEEQRVFVYQTMINDKPWLGVLYGKYATMTDAQTMLGRFPEPLRRHGPFIRNIRDLRRISSSSSGPRVTNGEKS